MPRSNPRRSRRRRHHNGVDPEDNDAASLASASVSHLESASESEVELSVAESQTVLTNSNVHPDEEESDDDEVGGRDYSEEWLKAMESSTQSAEDIEYHYLLISILETMRQRRYPSVKPPKRARTEVDPDVRESAPESLPTNIFGLLADDDDDDEDSDHEDTAAAADDGTRRTTQVRYLLIQAKCGVADCISASARQCLTNREYSEIPSLWKEAYQVLYDSSLFADPFLAVLIEAKENNITVLPYRHNRERLEEAMECLQSMSDHTLKKLKKSVHDMEQKKLRLERKLEDLLRNKDEIIAAKGLDWWEQHQPTNSKVEIKAELRKEMMLIDDALAEIERNDLVNKLGDIVEQLGDSTTTESD